MFIEMVINWVFPAFLGWILGVIVNYIADVIPNKRKLAFPYCEQCQNNFQIVNYVCWPRKCINCGYRRGVRTGIVELIFITVTIYFWQNPPQQIGFVWSMVLFLYFGVVSVIDIEHRLILHATSLVGVILGLIIGIRLHGIISTIFGGMLGFGGMLVLYYMGILYSRIYARMRSQPVDEEALGFGDVILSGVLGFLLGWPGIVVGILFAVIIGGIGSLIYIFYLLISKRYHPNIALPYGPFIIISAIILLFFKDLIV